MNAPTQRPTTWPKAIRRGDTLHVVAPSGPVPAERLERGMKQLRRALGVELTCAANVFEQDGYFAGPDAVRIAALHKAFSDPESRALVCARGGYGATRLLSALDPERLRNNPKLIVGFSDISALMAWAWVRAGVPSLHGPVVTQLPDMHAEDMQRYVDWLSGEVPPPLTASEGTVIHGGTVEGPLIASNLEVLRCLIGTRYFPPLAGTLLAIEEVHERPYRVDRTLTQLLSSGVLRGIRGVIVGQLRCPPAEGAITPPASQVVQERLSTLGVPVATGFEFGHDPNRNAAIPFGAQVRLHADDCTLEFLEPITR